MFASWLIDGPQLMLASLRQIDMLTVLSLLYLGAGHPHYRHQQRQRRHPPGFIAPQQRAPDTIADEMLTVLSLLYLAFIATLVGYGIWGSLLGRYETWRVAEPGHDQRRPGELQSAQRLPQQQRGAGHPHYRHQLAGLYINVFGLRLVRPGMARG
jgi:O-acetylserine/cysteine efflux transporter